MRLALLSEEKTLPQGECITYCFCVLSVWNYKSVTIKTRRGTLPSICKARDSCHARCSSFTRVKPTFTACARLASPSFLERAEEKLATFFYRVHPCILCTFIFMSRKRFTCSVVMVTVTFCVWLFLCGQRARTLFCVWVREWETIIYCVSVMNDNSLTPTNTT